MKGKRRKAISGLLSAVTILSALIQPFAAFAEEPEPAVYEAEYPALEKVRSELAEDEVVTVEDYEIEAGGSFDVEHDFSGLEIPPEKVEVKFYEAKNKEDQDFDVNRADTYQAVYFVIPVSGHPAYHVRRKIIVKEKRESGENALQESDSVPKESMTESEMAAVIADMEQAEDIREDAENLTEDGGLLLFSMDTGTNLKQSARALSGNVSLVTGREVYYPSNLGNYSTNYFTVNGRMAYCLESPKETPGTGSYASHVLEGNPNLQKTLYYGFGGAGDLTDQFMPQFGDDLKYVFTHIAASYFYCGIEGFEGCTMADLEACEVLGWINYLADQPAPPDPYISLTKTSLKASSNGSEQATGVTRLEGDSRNFITLRIPENVTFHNQNDGTKQTGGSVRISGGTSFYFTAPMSVSGTWNTGEMMGSIRNIWKALVVTTGGSNQDIGSYYEEESGNSVSFSVEWMELAKVKVIKVDSVSNIRLSGAVFGIYSDEACRNLILTMPATNQPANKKSSINF